MTTRSTLLGLLLLAAVLGFACKGKSGEEKAREQLTPEDIDRQKATGSSDTTKPLPPAPKPIADAAVAEPEPTTPEEIDKARKKAMIDGRDKDVIKYCEMAGITEKSDQQAALGCALAACRLKETDKAKTWSSNLPKELKETAIKVCAANAVQP